MPKKNTNPATPPGNFTDGILSGGFPDLELPGSSFLDDFHDAEPAVPDPAAEYDADGSRRRIGLATDPIIRRKSPRRTLRRLGREAAAVEQLQRLPEPGETYNLILTGRWHGFDLVGAIIELAKPDTVDRLEIATLGFNVTQTHHLADLLDAGAIGSVRFLVSDMFKEKNPAEFGILRTELESRGQTVAARRNHAKLLLFEMASGRKLAGHGSLNLRRCNSFEQLEISTDPTLHDFFRDFITDAIEDTITA